MEPFGVLTWGVALGVIGFNVGIWAVGAYRIRRWRSRRRRSSAPERWPAVHVFVCLKGRLPELRQTEDARNIARKLLSVLSADYIVSGHKLQVTPSIGISVYPEHARESSTLIRLADQAMYKAKQAGRRTFRFYGN